jgi:hypothetical protein
VKNLTFKVSATPPSYDGFWSPVTGENSPHLRFLFAVRSGRLYRVTGFPENTLPSNVEGYWAGGKNWAVAGVYKKRADGAYIPLGSNCSGVWTGSNKVYCVFTLEEGKLHIRYDSKSYRLKFTPCPWTEADLITLWGG